MNTDKENPSILVVDDEPDNRANLADILGELDYRVDTAADGVAALDLLRQRRYDVALRDLMMPGMDGASLYQELKKLRPGTVALLVTAFPNSARADVALSAGAWKVVPKPIDLARLLPLVEEAAEQPLVLVVDDDPDLCANLWDLLREQNCRVCLADDVPSAIRRIHEDQFKVILLDMKLPGGDGNAVLRTALAANAQAQVIVITGYQNEFEPRLREMLDKEVRAVFTKPIDIPDLLSLVERLVAD